MLNVVKRNGEVCIQPIALNTYLEQQRRYDRDVESYMLKYHTPISDEDELAFYHQEFPDNCYWAGLKVDRVIRQIPTNPIVFNNSSPLSAVAGLQGLSSMRPFALLAAEYPDRVFLVRGLSRRWSEQILLVEHRIVSKQDFTPVLRNYKLRGI